MIGTLGRLGKTATARELAREAGLSVAKTNGAVARLEDEGVVERSADGASSISTLARNPGARVVHAVAAQHELREAQRARIEPIRRFARSRDCRRAILLEYFGDHLDGPCTGCDNCDLRRRLSEPAA